MAGIFRRTLSFPVKNTNRPSKPPISQHTRSISLPCRSHPLLSQLREHVSNLRACYLNPGNRTATWLCDCLRRLKDVHDTLGDILHLPQTQDFFTRNRPCVEDLLGIFLRFVDLYGIFQASIFALKEDQLAACFSLRRRDESKIRAYLKARKQMANELAKLASSIRLAGRRSGQISGSSFASGAEAELAGLLNDGVQITVAVSAVVFEGISVSLGRRKASWTAWRLGKKVAEKGKTEAAVVEELKRVGEESLRGLKKKGDEEVKTVLRRMQESEVCLLDVYNRTEKLSRSLTAARVSLLNTLTK